MNLAPVVLFVYNRPWHVRQTLESLAANYLAEESELIVFADGPKVYASEEEMFRIKEVREIVKGKKWCKTTELIESEINKGLTESIISGVTKIINNHGKIIVLEDDLILSKFFIRFINEALVFFNNEKNVMHISGHSFPLKGIKKDIYFLNYVSPHGWGTWKDRWSFFENDANVLLNRLNTLPDFNLVNFNCGFGNEFYSQLTKNVNKELNTWAVKWHTSIFLKGGVSLFPKQSLIDNTGFDSSGTNSGNSKPYFSEVNNQKMPEISSIPIEINKVALKSFKKYYNKYHIPDKKVIIIAKKIYGRFKSIFMGKKKPGAN